MNSSPSQCVTPTAPSTPLTPAGLDAPVKLAMLRALASGSGKPVGFADVKASRELWASYRRSVADLMRRGLIERRVNPDTEREGFVGVISSAELESHADRLEARIEATVSGVVK